NENDKYYYLHKRLDDNYDLISDLERQLMVETADREKAETGYALKIGELEHQRDEELEPLKERVVSMEEQINGMHEAADNKRECDANKARLELELNSTIEALKQEVTVEQRKTLQEKQRIRREIEVQLREATNELLSKKELELVEKTARARFTYEKLGAALYAKSKQAERVVANNQGLATDNVNLRNEVELALSSQETLGHRVHLYQNMVTGLKVQLESRKSSNASSTSRDTDLAELEESLMAELDSASSLPPDITLEAGVGADGACDGLVYRSVDELRAAIESLQ
ncbi:unnamed protein product, partial [Choristocarpus tenellus]